MNTASVKIIFQSRLCSNSCTKASLWFTEWISELLPQPYLLYFVLYLSFSPSFTNFHLIFFPKAVVFSLFLFPISLSVLLALRLMLHAISPECLCYVFQLQAERFIAAICSFCHSPSLPLSLCPSLCLTQAIIYWLHPPFFIPVFLWLVCFILFMFTLRCLTILSFPFLSFGLEPFHLITSAAARESK